MPLIITDSVLSWEGGGVGCYWEVLRYSVDVGSYKRTQTDRWCLAMYVLVIQKITSGHLVTRKSEYMLSVMAAHWGCYDHKVGFLKVPKEARHLTPIEIQWELDA